MKTKLLFLALLSLMIVVSACKKSDDEENNIPRIKTEVRSDKDGFNTVLRYEYDASGRLSKETIGSKYSTYSYLPGMIIRNNYSLEALTGIDTLILNKQGLVVSDTLGTYEYNSQGYLVKLTIPNKNDYTYKTENGNTTQYVDNKDVDIYTFQTFDFNTQNNTIGNENKGKAWLGKQDINLPSYNIISRINSPYATYSTVRYDYEFDNLKRVTKQLINKDGIKTYISYTYY